MVTLSEIFTNIANAIRSKTGSTTTYSPDQMPQAISEITTGSDTSDATASAADIANGKTAYARGSKITGTNTKDSDTSDATALNTDILSGKTAYVQGSKVTGTNTKDSDTSDATLDSGSRMLSGYTAYSKGVKYTGDIITQPAKLKPCIEKTHTIFDPGYYPNGPRAFATYGCGSFRGRATISVFDAVDDFPITNVIVYRVNSSTLAPLQGSDYYVEIYDSSVDPSSVYICSDVYKRIVPISNDGSTLIETVNAYPSGTVKNGLLTLNVPTTFTVIYIALYNKP